MVRGALALGYGVVAYLAFLAALAVLVAFLSNLGLLRGMDEGPSAPVAVAIVIDLALVALFGVSHSVMARGSFKKRWTRLVPRSAERSTYVLVASLVLILIAWQWRAIPEVIWNVNEPIARAALWTLSAAGLLLTVFSTFLTDHFDLFGLRHVWLYARGRPYSAPPFQERSLYRFVRHPMMVGLLVWMWATPTLTVGHALFAAAMSAYIGVGVAFEERDLSAALGQSYRDYRRRVRAFVPNPPSE